MQRKLWAMFLVQNWFQYLIVNLEVFQKDDKKIILAGPSSYNGRSRFQPVYAIDESLVVAAEIFAREENLPPVLIATLSKDMDEQLKLAYKLVELVDRANRKISVTVLRWSLDEAENTHAQVRSFARKKEDEKFQQVVSVNYKLEEIIYLLDVMNSVYHKVITNQPICFVS